MRDRDMEGFANLDREGLIRRMAVELPGILKILGVSLSDFAEKVGIDEDRLSLAKEGENTLQWSEYMSILFVLWRNERAKGIVESKGLFPDTLKAAMSVNRNAHAPVTESFPND